MNKEGELFSGSLPVPVKSTSWPTLIMTLDAGVLIKLSGAKLIAVPPEPGELFGKTVTIRIAGVVSALSVLQEGPQMHEINWDEAKEKAMNL